VNCEAEVKRKVEEREAERMSVAAPGTRMQSRARVGEAGSVVAQITSQVLLAQSRRREARKSHSVPILFPLHRSTLYP
jgi:hypothetical protein